MDELELPYGVTLSPGRPEIGDLLSASIGCTSALKRSTPEGVHGVIVGVCGPEELMSHVRQVENAIGSQVRATVGGVELVEECVTFFRLFLIIRELTMTLSFWQSFRLVESWNTNVLHLRILVLITIAPVDDFPHLFFLF